MQTQQMIENITTIGDYALSMTYEDVYRQIVRYMMKQNPIMRPELAEMSEELHGEWHFEEGHSPEDLSMKHFGINIFPFNVFDYYLMAYSIVHDEIGDYFELLKSRWEVSNSEWYYLSEKEREILSLFDPNTYGSYDRTKEKPNYRSQAFSIFLQERVLLRSQFLELMRKVSSIVSQDVETDN